MCLLALPLLHHAGTQDIKARKPVIAVGIGLMIVVVINRLVGVGLSEMMFSFDLFCQRAPLLFMQAYLHSLTPMIYFYFYCIGSKTVTLYLGDYFLLAGFIPYVMLFIRSNHNPPIDEIPKGFGAHQSFMNRDSYGSTITVRTVLLMLK
jgi:hypothetical protein